MSQPLRRLAFCLATTLAVLTLNSAIPAVDDRLTSELIAQGISVTQLDNGLSLATLADEQGNQRGVMFGPSRSTIHGKPAVEVMAIELLPRGMKADAACAKLRDRGYRTAKAVATTDGQTVIAVTSTLSGDIDARTLLDDSQRIHQLITSQVPSSEPAKPGAIAPPADSEDDISRIEGLRNEEQILRNDSALCERYYREWQAKADAEFNNRSEFHTPSVLPSIYANTWFSRWKASESRLMRVQREIAREQSK